MSGAQTIDVKRCTGCAHVYFGEEGTCSHCGCKELERSQCTGRGIIYSFTVNHVPPLHLKDKSPYVVAVIDLVEGHRITARLNTPKSEITIGKEVVFLAKTPMGLVFE